MAKKKASKKARKSGGASRAHPSKPKVKPVKPRPQPRQKKNIIVQPLGIKTPLEDFFSQYPKFPFQPSKSPVVEFNRLCKTYQWERDDPEREAAREEFQDAMKKEFDNLYGSDEKDIKNWQKLCYVLRIDPVPDTLQKCRDVSCRFSEPLCPRTKTSSFVQEVLKKHVNLVDLVHGSKEEVQIFETEGDLSEYTKKTGKYFPKESAVDGGVLRALRRHILAPHEGTSSSMKKFNPGRNPFI
ncbi:hypothetical protein H4582DRAFT_1903118 [Lactarius indigo]|nr:hypothetical protein H4582DRAFT_1903118 [Lactarius indigo]